MPASLATLPNYLTVFRIVVLPLLAILIVRNEGFWACVVLTIAGITDILDGYLARRHRQETAFGKLLDPVADKILLCVALVFLCATPHRALDPWVATLLLSREFMVTGLRAMAATAGIVVGAGQTGKLKTFFQMFGLGSVMVGGHPWGIPAHNLGLLCLWIAVVLSYVSMVQYSRAVYYELQKRP